VAEIVLDHVVKRYPDGALAVDDFNLEIADGEFIILVGRPAAGSPPRSTWWPGWRTSLPGS
jgi:multiple sugar transport system ATP-binding protein